MLLPLVAVAALCLSSGPLAAGEIVVEQNLTYAEVGDVKLQLDLAHPKDGDGPFPGIVFIHGGGWSGGNRHTFRSQMEEAARRGYVAVTISYRLTQPDKETGTPKEPFPAQIHDCKAAVRWLRQHGGEYKLDRERIGVTGASAGGHLSLLIGLSSREDGIDGNEGNLSQSTRVQAVVNIFGPTDLARCYETSPGAVGFLKALCNGTPESAAAKYRSGSPVTYVTSDDPPVLTLHGDKDALVPPEQATLLDARMKAAGAKHELKLLKDQGHGFNGDAAKEANDATWAFFERYLKPSKN
ncbi:MAG: alpha/beta hydrolase [Planctomycetaceae bacterium]|nr:alpha/beta hydrolase [Planctomycetaceae bacterium]